MILDVEKTSLVAPPTTQKAPYQKFNLTENKKEPFRFDQKKKFLAAIIGSALLLIIFIIVAIVSLSNSGIDFFKFLEK